MPLISQNTTNTKRGMKRTKRTKIKRKETPRKRLNNRPRKMTKRTKTEAQTVNNTRAATQNHNSKPNLKAAQTKTICTVSRKAVPRNQRNKKINNPR